MLIQDGNAKLADFAMSTGALIRVASSHQSRSITIAGTDAYSAPEVTRGGRRALSPASDMYSMGMLLYHVIEEDAPWAGESNTFIVRQIEAGELPRFESSDWTTELQAFVQVKVAMCKYYWFLYLS